MGVSTPLGTPASRSRTRPSWAGPALARELACASPTRRSSAKAPRAARAATATSVAAQRARTTARAQAVQARLEVASRRSRRRGQSSRRPPPASSTGSRVMVTSALTRGMSTPA